MILTFDDTVTLSDFKMCVLKGYESPLMPEIINKTMQIPSRAGAWDFGSELGPTSVKYPISQLSNDRIERAELLRKFISFLCDKKGKPRLIKLTKDDEPGLYLMCKIAVAPAPKYNSVGADFEIELTANNPFKRASSDQFDPTSPIFYGEVNQGDCYPNTSGFTWNIVPNHYSAIFNYSDLETDLKITITGTVKGGSIKNLANNEELTIPDLTNGTMVIDGENFCIQINGEDALLGNANFFTLEPGSNGFQFIATTANASVVYDWMHKFL